MFKIERKGGKKRKRSWPPRGLKVTRMDDIAAGCVEKLCSLVLGVVYRAKYRNLLLPKL